ncbi:Transcriptional regulatory protein ros [Methylobacterium dankookense]|uniref:Transcriptional regulatory protein ros n=1 Tax=Methylobacterium dankookense TaxID=560405 RepID=A0A564G795_9HYPH|nr:Transcriptional regulatory protein ros [Methylobacterium dankookense]VUF15896.1 Transcriptional regulatory protein ros [Methylobacterium dankookense]
MKLAADIVAAYVSNNHVQGAELPKLLLDVHDVIAGMLDGGQAAAETGPAKPTPQEVKRSVTYDHLVSFEDGKPYKTLRRHLTLRGLTPEAYRAKWGLPVDYPMTAKSYSEQRSQLARALGLGQQRRGTPEAEAAPEPELVAEEAAKPRRAVRRKETA